MDILVVDDNIKSLQNVAKFIRKLGHNVDECESAFMALELFKKRSYQVVFSDIKMPQMSGIDLLKVIPDFSSDTKVVLITAYADLQTSIEAVRYNAFDYLLKPISIEKLIDVIERVNILLAETKIKRSLNILLYSKQLFLAEGICVALRTEKDFNVANYTHTYTDFTRQAELGKCDIILVDVDSIPMEKCISIYFKYPKKTVIALTSYEIGSMDIPLSIPVISLDNCSPYDLILRLKSFLKNSFIEMGTSVDMASAASLGTQEKEILLRVAQGKTNKEIAQELYLSPTTIRNYVSKILQKLNIPNRTAAALFVSKYMLNND
ncbi:MAG: response regulator [Bacillota bacterium]